jgi:hypothetical protein
MKREPVWLLNPLSRSFSGQPCLALPSLRHATSPDYSRNSGADAFVRVGNDAEHAGMSHEKRRAGLRQGARA